MEIISGGHCCIENDFLFASSIQCTVWSGIPERDKDQICFHKTDNNKLNEPETFRDMKEA